jgi:hypothetical protein
MNTMNPKWIIESRDDQGKLLLTGPQPETIFGLQAIQGMSDWHMSRVIFQNCPDATLDGGNIPNWPKLINPNWKARRKTW